MAKRTPYKTVYFIKNNLDKTDVELGKLLGLPKSTVSGIRKRKGLLKPNNGRFKKGQKPLYVNKVSNSGSFKKGHPSTVKYSDGITIQSNHGKQYKWIRLGEGKRQLLHQYVWKQASGEIPKGYIIGFRDKDTLNCELSNLFLKSRAEHLRENTNREKASKSLKKVWSKVKLFEAYGLKHDYKFTSTRKHGK